MTEAELQAWIQDLQSGMYINCVYCGHRYGPNTTAVPADALRRHIAECTEHPLGQLVQVCKAVIQTLSNRQRTLGSLDPIAWWIKDKLTQAVREAET
jgi:hypothetical protein